MGGVGSDGGGSIRVPAHFCGICGLKPTPGRIPATGYFPSGAGAFGWIGVVGALARTIADVRALFEVMSGPDPGDAHSAPVPLRTYPENDLGTRIGILESSALGSATAETRSAVDRAAKLLSDRGFSVEPFELRGLDRALDLWWFFFGSVIAHLLNTNLAGHESQPSPMLREYLSIAAPRAPLSVDEFIQACAERDLLRKKSSARWIASAFFSRPFRPPPRFATARETTSLASATATPCTCWRRSTTTRVPSPGARTVSAPPTGRPC